MNYTKLFVDFCALVVLFNKISVSSLVFLSKL